MNLQIVEAGPSDPPHPTRGKIANTTKENQLITIEQTNSFIVTQLLYLNGHLMAINLSTLTKRMLMFDAPPKVPQNKPPPDMASRVLALFQEELQPEEEWPESPGTSLPRPN